MNTAHLFLATREESLLSAVMPCAKLARADLRTHYDLHGFPTVLAAGEILLLSAHIVRAVNTAGITPPAGAIVVLFAEEAAPPHWSGSALRLPDESSQLVVLLSAHTRTGQLTLVQGLAGGAGTSLTAAGLALTMRESAPGVVALVDAAPGASLAAYLQAEGTDSNETAFTGLPVSSSGTADDSVENTDGMNESEGFAVLVRRVLAGAAQWRGIHVLNCKELAADSLRALLRALVADGVRVVVDAGVFRPANWQGVNQHVLLAGADSRSLLTWRTIAGLHPNFSLLSVLPSRSARAVADLLAEDCLSPVTRLPWSRRADEQLQSRGLTAFPAPAWWRDFSRWAARIGAVS